jgi:hypothetical protein
LIEQPLDNGCPEVLSLHDAADTLNPSANNMSESARKAR